MFCPACGYEYLAGVAVCADCGVPLVAALPAVPPPVPVAYEEVLATLNPGEIALVKSLLEEAGIDIRFATEIAGPPLALPARLFVPADKADEARELLRGLIDAEPKPGRQGGTGEKG